MDKIFGDGIKKFVLMGIGAAAMTVEKSQQMVDELVKKGELTVEQGKELNQELKRNVKKTIDEAAFQYCSALKTITLPNSKTEASPKTEE